MQSEAPFVSVSLPLLMSRREKNFFFSYLYEGKKGEDLFLHERLKRRRREGASLAEEEEGLKTMKLETGEKIQQSF